MIMVLISVKVTSVNSLEALYLSMDEAVIYSKLLSIAKASKLGVGLFPLLDQCYYSHVHDDGVFAPQVCRVGCVAWCLLVLR